MRTLFKLIIYFATITLLVALMGWTAHISWQRTGDVQSQLSAKQWQSFQISEHLQQGILGLNNLVLRYAAYRENSDWTNFVAGSQDLDRWLETQQPILVSQTERPFMERIRIAFDDYLAAADAIHTKIYPTRHSVTRVVECPGTRKVFPAHPGPGPATGRGPSAGHRTHSGTEFAFTQPAAL